MNLQKEIEKTAYVLKDLVKCAIPNSAIIADELEKIIGPQKSPTEYFFFLNVSRHLTTRTVLDKLDPSYQIIELGAGFSPHSFNYSKRFRKYIEIDLPYNSKLKQQIITALNPRNTISFIGGDAFQDSAWSEAHKLLDVSAPVFVFCEGFISHYATETEKDYLAGQFRKSFKHPECILYLDDSLKNHPELDSSPIVKKGKSELKVTLDKTSYRELPSRSLESERLHWGERGLYLSNSVDYVLMEGFESVLSNLKGSLFKMTRGK